MSESVVCKAVAYHAELPEGRAAGELHPGERFLEFKSAVRSWSLSLDEIELKFQGFNNEGATITHPRAPGLTIICADASLLKAPGLTDHPGHARSMKRAARHRRRIPRPVKFMIAFFALIIAGLVALWAARDSIIQAVVDKIPVSLEESWGEAYYTQLSATGMILDDAEYTRKVEAAVGRLRPVLAKTPYSFRFHVLKDSTINAYACPGGEVLITTGMLDFANPEELAGVLAHEVAHVIKRHTLEHLVSNIGLMALISAWAGDVAGLGTLVTQGAKDLLGQKFSRDNEREADDKGFDLLVEAGINPAGMVSMHQKLKDLGAIEPPPLLNTHPATDARIQHLGDRLREVAGRKFEPLEETAAAPGVSQPLPPVE